MTSQSEQDRRIDYVEFITTDVGQSKSFYTSVFSWSFTDYGPEYCSFQDGRMNGGFRKVDEPAPHGTLVVIYANDLEDIQERVIRAGGVIVRDTFSFPGGRRFHFEDPTGNVLAVWTEE